MCVRDIDPALVEQVVDVSQRERKADVHHHRYADDFERRLKYLNGLRFERS